MPFGSTLRNVPAQGVACDPTVARATRTRRVACQTPILPAERRGRDGFRCRRCKPGLGDRRRCRGGDSVSLPSAPRRRRPRARTGAGHGFDPIGAGRGPIAWFSVSTTYTRPSGPAVILGAVEAAVLANRRRLRTPWRKSPTRAASGPRRAPASRRYSSRRATHITSPIYNARGPSTAPLGPTARRWGVSARRFRRSIRSARC